MNYTINKSKINPLLIDNVSILTRKQTKNVIVSVFDFVKAEHSFNQQKLQFKPYPFANCFCMCVNYNEMAKLSNESYVKYIDPCVKVCAEQKQQDNMNLSALTQQKHLGKGTTICFIDTGIFPHFDFLFPQNRIIKFIDFVNHNNIPYDDNGHGTFVAGIACGNGNLNKQNIGFAPKANIVAIKALSSAGTSDSNIILDAMQWVYENYKQYNISIVCMSFGADFANSSDPLSRGADALWRKGLTIVAAAGNSGPNERTIKSPGNNPNIITVGGLDETSMQVADFSSRGPTTFGYKPDLIAPAVDVVSCALNDPYTTMSGTSVATPIIAGICADLKSMYPQISNYQIKNFLLKNCVKLTGDPNSEGAGFLKF